MQNSEFEFWFVKNQLAPYGPAVVLQLNCSGPLLTCSWLRSHNLSCTFPLTDHQLPPYWPAVVLLQTSSSPSTELQLASFWHAVDFILKILLALSYWPPVAPPLACSCPPTDLQLPPNWPAVVFLLTFSCPWTGLQLSFYWPSIAPLLACSCPLIDQQLLSQEAAVVLLLIWSVDELLLSFSWPPSDLWLHSF